MSDETPPATRRGRRKPASKAGTQAGAQAGKPAGKRPRASSSAPPAPASDVAPQTAETGLIRVPLSVRWRDLDAFNHVNNSKFLSYLEEARLRWMIQLPGEWIDDNVAPVVAAAHVNYRRPIAWPNEIVVELFVERLGSTSLTIGHRIVQADDASVLFADGNVVMVWIDKQRGQPSPLPEAVRTACT